MNHNCPTCGNTHLCKYCGKALHGGGQGSPDYCDTSRCPNSYYGTKTREEALAESRARREKNG